MLFFVAVSITAELTHILRQSRGISQYNRKSCNVIGQIAMRLQLCLLYWLMDWRKMLVTSAVLKTLPNGNEKRITYLTGQFEVNVGYGWLISIAICWVQKSGFLTKP